MDLVKPAEVFHFVKNKIVLGEKTIIANHNLHSLHLVNNNTEMQDFFAKADLIEIDSLPLIFWARLIGRPSRSFHRCTYLDWRDEFWKMATENGWRVFFVGGREGVADSAREAIQKTWPDTQLEVHHGFFDIDPSSLESHALLEQIQAFKPHIILVGMGMPRQEAWIVRNYDALPTSVLFTVGGAFDYEAGVQVVCPRWIGQLGMEWLFRLALNPRRLFGRYCIEPWRLIGPAVRDLRDVSARVRGAVWRGLADRAASFLGQTTAKNQPQAS